MGLPRFTYFQPETLSNLESLLIKHQGKAKVLAGGTDLMVQMKAGLLAPAVLVDIGNLKDLQGISNEEGKGITILAGTKIAAIEHSPLIKEKLPALVESAALIGSSQVRAMASLGGNSCNASPSAETPPILIALGTEAIVGSAGSVRKIPLENFFLAYRHVDLNPGEYLKAFFIPDQPSNAGSAYLCRMLRRAMEIDIVNVGVRLLLDKKEKCQEARIALGAVAPVPVRARKAEAVLVGKALTEKAFRQAGEAAAGESTPIDDIRASAEYRREMVEVLVRRALQQAAARIKG
jgi:carbon-monoxide dehydrogenase medium subunit